MKKREDIPADLPGQAFFAFAEPPPAAPVRMTENAPQVRSTPKRAPRPEIPADVPAELARGIQPEAAELTGGFVTEKQVSELFLGVAAQLRPGQVVRARITFKPFRSTLYSFKIGKNGTALVKFHQAFRQASETVLLQAMQLMLARRKADRKLLQRDAYDAFTRALPLSDFALPGARKARRVAQPGPGRHRSLEASFERVNITCFGGKLEMPELCWSPVRARRVLGSYQERYDRLIISKVFDTPQVPEFVLDYLMFHELLHKFLGIGRRQDGRRCMHGPEFRSLEKQFKYFEQAQLFLKRL